MPTPSTALSLRRLCAAQTLLAPDDVATIERWAESLPALAELAQADVFIDCLTRAPDVALVVAQASPGGGHSLYKTSVVGQLALRENEPGVLETLRTGQSTLARRGITQEGIPVRQRVVPIRSPAGSAIGALILEQDITEELKREARLGLLAETTGHLTETIVALARQSQTLPSLLHEGILIVDAAGRISYANPTAVRFLQDLGGPADPVGCSAQELGLHHSPGEIITRELHGACATFRAVPIDLENPGLGQIILLRDVTEIRAKERELMVKSAVIREMHHRVKNNLQTIASLLRLQARRVQSPEARQVLDDALGRIASIATVHEVLAAEGIELVDLRQMAADIGRLVQGSLVDAQAQIHLEVVGEPVLLAADKATAVALVLNELLQNALDHAYPPAGGPDGGPAEQPTGRIRVEISQADDYIQLTVADDGQGLPDDFALPAGGNLGLQIVQTLVEHHLGGQLQLTSQRGAGTQVTIRFPTGKGGDSHAPDHRTAG